MYSDPRNPASQTYSSQQYVQQTAANPQQRYYQPEKNDSNHLKSFLLSVTPNILHISAFIFFAFLYGLFAGELDGFLDFFFYNFILIWLFSSFTITMLSTYLAFNHDSSKLWQVIGPPLGLFSSILLLLLLSAILSSETVFETFGDDSVPVFGAAVCTQAMISLMTMLLLHSTASKR